MKTSLNHRGRCLWCERPLPKGRRKYCSDECSMWYFIYKIEPLWWGNAVKQALDRAENKCENCGSIEKLEVHHIIGLESGEQRHNSKKNSQDNLKVLCRQCHERAHHGAKVIQAIPKEQLALKI